MKHDTHEATGKINANGDLMIYNMEIIKQWAKQWPDKKIVLNMLIIDNSSKSQIVYFYKHILPQFKKGMHELGNCISEDECLQIIYSECPFCGEKGELITIDKMTQSRLNLTIEWVKWYASTNLNIFIND